METWGFAISFATCQPGNRSVEGVTTRPSSLVACIKVLPVVISTRVENYSLAAALAIIHIHEAYSMLHTRTVCFVSLFQRLSCRTNTINKFWILLDNDGSFRPDSPPAGRQQTAPRQLKFVAVQYSAVRYKQYTQYTKCTGLQ